MARAALALAAVVLLAAAPEAPPQTGAIGAGPDGLTFQQARARFPQLPQVMFDRADLNGDGVIDSRELPVLQGMYNQSFRAR